MSPIPVRFSKAPAPAAKKSLFCECIANSPINSEISSLEFAWSGPAPRGGQFFLVKPERTGVFLARPLSAAAWRAPAAAAPDESADSSPDKSGVLRFLVARRGRGPAELMDLRPGERAELSGPLGNSWEEASAFKEKAGAEFPEGAAALIAGGIGIAPLLCYARELGSRDFDFYAGFKSGSFGLDGLKPRSLVVATEDGSEGLAGRIPDFFSPAGYSLVCACGPEPMLKAVAEICADTGVPCLVSMERRMACGVGACLGCTVQTWKGNRRCCADGPVFNALEVKFDD